ncbi:MAG: hypothetical protein QI197_03800 [Candidatus Korarchaeota archaeon]|nr:hypothetical protein [Candidatus Korarchaeota archaeon]
MKTNPLLFQQVLEWVRKLNSRASFSDVEVIVEGPKDEAALEDIGVRATFTHASRLIRDIRELGEARIIGRTFIILTDFDTEGLTLHDKLKRIITEMGGKVDEFPRSYYKSTGLPPLVEEVSSFLKRRVAGWSILTEGWRSEQHW